MARNLKYHLSNSKFSNCNLEYRSNEWLGTNRTIENFKIERGRAYFIICSLPFLQVNAA